MTLPIVSATRALELLRVEVAEAGTDYTYSAPEADKGCVYEYQGEPSCLVGRVMHRHGVPIETLIKWNPEGGFDAIHDAPVTDDAMEILNFAQSRQDGGLAWSDVLADTQAYAERQGYVKVGAA